MLWILPEDLLGYLICAANRDLQMDEDQNKNRFTRQKTVVPAKPVNPGGIRCYDGKNKGFVLLY